MYFAVRGYEVPSELSEPSRTPGCFWRKLKLLLMTANASYRRESEAEAVPIATPGSVYTSINGFWQLQHPSIWSLRYDTSCIFNGQTAGALHVEQMAVDWCKRLGDGELYNAICWKRNSWSPTLADIRHVLEHCYAVTQHLVHSIRGTHKGVVVRGMLKQQPM